MSASDALPTASRAPLPARVRASFRPRFRFTIRDKILLAFLVVILLMTAVTGVFMWRALQYNRQYGTMLSNATIANRLSGEFKTRTDSAVWDAVAGMSELAGGPAYAILDDLDSDVHLLMDRTDSRRGRLKLDVVLRTVSTLRGFVNRMAFSMESGSTVADSEAMLEEARWLSGLVQELLSDYMIFEVNRMGQKAEQLQRNFNQWVAALVVLLVGVIAFSALSAWRISKGVYTPIKQLHDAAVEVTQQDVAALVRGNNIDELDELGESFNIMVGQIRSLLDAKVEEQDRVKKAELKALQAQINPHFLYNTLDTIIWKAEANQKEEVIALVQALSSFFRISLNKGREWISARDEVEHVRAYLAIQGMRYRDILRYEIEMDEAIGDATLLKLTLQQLVENAIYHGIKNKRGGGKVSVRASELVGGTLLFEVEDDGVGIEPAQLEALRCALSGSEPRVESSSGVGLLNVNDRIKLYYGNEYGLRIESARNVGTVVSLAIPHITIR